MIMGERLTLVVRLAFEVDARTRPPKLAFPFSTTVLGNATLCGVFLYSMVLSMSSPSRSWSGVFWSCSSSGKHGRLFSVGTP